MIIKNNQAFPATLLPQCLREHLTNETWSDVCRTLGSGIIQPFNGSNFYVRSTCPFLLTHFTHNRVECTVTTQRDDSGLLVRVEIIVNKVRTILQNGNIQVEGERLALIPRNTIFKISNISIYKSFWFSKVEVRLQASTAYSGYFFLSLAASPSLMITPTSISLGTASTPSWGAPWFHCLSPGTMSLEE